ncbi:MAG: LuxR C-terminal-related transcriptional regulator [Actinomycetota bacterium]|nr:LuxR C-terminal-related transcriptional regulator [Actinomycetota bacterium]
MTDAAILRALADLLAALATHTTPEQVLSQVASLPVSLPLTGAAAVLRRHDDGMVLVGTSGMGDADVESLEQVAADPRGPIAEAVAALHVASSARLVASPIVAEGTAVGVLVLGVPTEPQWSVSDLAVLGAVSAAMGMCMTHDSPHGRDTPLGSPALTARQAAIMRRVEEGRSNTAIAALLRVSESTVKQEVRRVAALLRAPDRMSAARRTRELGLLEDA